MNELVKRFSFTDRNNLLCLFLSQNASAWSPCKSDPPKPLSVEKMNIEGVELNQTL